MILRQSTSQSVRFGPFLDETDAVTAETSLTIAQADMLLSKDGGAFAQKNAAGNASHDTAGWYSTTLNASDTDTVGELVMQVSISGALPVWVRWFVVEEAIYDSLFASSATGFDGSGQVTVGTNNDKSGYSLSASGLDSVVIAEPSGVFAWGGTLREVLGWLGALSRNKITQTSTTQTLRNDADSGDISTAAVSDDGSTFTRSEWS
ncbi:MAG: hypothetical protein ACFCUQ_07485 [Kiloniellales bacterium]